MASGVRFDVRTSGGKELRGAVAATAKAARAAAERATADETEAVADDERAHVPRDTDELYDSIKHRAAGLKGEVAATARHSTHVEHGTWKDPAQPFVAPAAERSRRRYPDRVSDEVRRAVE